MKSIKLKIVFILFLLIKVPFSCINDDGCLELEVMPYYKMMDLAFKSVEYFYINPKSQKPMPQKVSQDFDTYFYACDSMMLYFEVPAAALLFHAQNNNIRKGFGLTEAIACELPGHLGTLDKVDKIFISSKYDFDETHLAGYDLSDIVDIFAYTIEEEDGGFMLLGDYNESSPHTAPKRFYLLLRRKARLSEVQQFVITYHLMGEEGEDPREFRVETPRFNVKLGR